MNDMSESVLRQIFSKLSVIERVLGINDTQEGSGSSFGAEEAQDAVGTILANTSTVTLTYLDGVPSIAADVIPGGITHNSLGSLQGGTTAEYYHLTSAQHTELAAIAALGTAADKYIYTTGIDTWAEATVTSFIRGLLDDADAATARTTLGIAAGTTEELQDLIGAMVSGNTETGISVTYDDTNGKLDFNAQTAGDARYGRLATANTWTQNQTLNSTQTSGSALAITRNLTNTSTDAAVVDIIQDHTGDDQAVLRVQQDGTGRLVSMFDGATEVFAIADGGLAAFGGTPVVGARLTVIDGACRIRLDSTTNDAAVAFVMAALGASGTQRSGGLYWVAHETATSSFFGISADNTTYALKAFRDNRVGIGATTTPLAATLDILQTQTAGNTLRAYRNLTATSTDSPIADLIQDHASDDQAVLRLQQDGTGKIISAFDGATEVFTLFDGGYLGLNVATAQGILHAFDGTGGGLLVSKTGIVGSAVVMIPDGTGDVTKGVRIMGVASNSTPTTFDVSIYIANGANSDITDGGGNTLRFAVAANGQLSVIRQAGALTWECSVLCVWK